MMATHSKNREAVQFLSNVPVEVALKYPDGKIIQGTYGERMMYTTCDDRVMFLDLDVGQKINMLAPQPGEKFWIVKARGSGKGAANVWKVWRQSSVQPATVDHESALERELRHSLALQGNPGVLVVPKLDGKVNGASYAPAPESKTMQPAAPHTVTSVGQPVNQPAPQPTTDRPKTQLESALKTVVHACHMAQLYAKELGFQMPLWTSEDMRTMANTLMIQANGSHK